MHGTTSYNVIIHIVLQTRSVSLVGYRRKLCAKHEYINFFPELHLIMTFSASHLTIRHMTVYDNMLREMLHDESFAFA